MNPVQHILILGVRLYRGVLSPAKMFLFGPQAGCRFTPSCSEYALQAVQTHGALAGSWLATKRLCRCHPWAIAGTIRCLAKSPKPEIGITKSRAWTLQQAAA